MNDIGLDRLSVNGIIYVKAAIAGLLFVTRVPDLSKLEYAPNDPRRAERVRPYAEAAIADADTFVKACAVDE